MSENVMVFDANALHQGHSNAESFDLSTSGRGGLLFDFIVGTRNRTESDEIGHSLSRRSWIFPLLWVFIGFVSAVDAYLTIRFHSYLEFEEQNPVGVMILSLSDWKPAQFIGIKYMGSTIVLGVLTALYSRNPPLGLTVTSAVAAFQLFLLCYLLL
jgi:hypothetical protein